MTGNNPARTHLTRIKRFWCQDPRRSQSQLVADLRRLNMGPALIKPLVPSVRIVMLGLDNSGKTTILYRIKKNIFSQHRPTIGFNCEKVWNYYWWTIRMSWVRKERKHFNEIEKSVKIGISHFIQFAQFADKLIFRLYNFQIACNRKLFQIWDVGGQEKTR